MCKEKTKRIENFICLNASGENGSKRRHNETRLTHLLSNLKKATLDI